MFLYSNISVRGPRSAVQFPFILPTFSNFRDSSIIYNILNDNQSLYNHLTLADSLATDTAASKNCRSSAAIFTPCYTLLSLKGCGLLVKGCGQCKMGGKASKESLLEKHGHLLTNEERAAVDSCFKLISKFIRS